MRKVLKIQVRSRPDGDAEYQVLEQSHRVETFGQTGYYFPQDAEYNAGVWHLASYTHPEYAKSSTCFWLRGRKAELDSEWVRIPHDKVATLLGLVAQYNRTEFLDCTTTAPNPLDETIKQFGCQAENVKKLLNLLDARYKFR